ncbi:hypothetical protein BVRB_006960 [Beta vulgaris subsp. vulgaris]|uniref:Uncharacterized protein n=1 Tax=Beta vulgaris subsp. vulgaris TaxID=3555 RepID=A0A0J8B6N9_BETVV|nr:hypothetical protein BVRB_006960 [Beta vulgaris subsp. vulgaris]
MAKSSADYEHEKPEVKKFRNKGIAPEIEDLWNRLYQDGYATGEHVVSTSIDPSSVIVVNVEDERSGQDNDEGVNENDKSTQDGIYPEYYPDLDNVDSQGPNFYSNLLKDVSSQVPSFSVSGDWGTQASDLGVSGSSNTHIPNADCQDTTAGSEPSNLKGRNGTRCSKQPQKCGTRTTKPIPMKRKGRQSSGSAMLSSHINTMVNTCSRALELMESDADHLGSVKAQRTYNDTSIATAMTIINDMCASECGLKKNSELWCCLVRLIEDGARREIFIKMDDDESRMTWLGYMHTQGI